MRFALLALLALARAIRADAAADPARYIKADLVSETMQPKPGSTILIGIRMTPQPGWHGYWSNPGDSGIAPSGTWLAPAGMKIGPLIHPAPSLMVNDGVASFVHAGPHVLLARMTIPGGIKRGARLPVVADLRWAACTPTQCVPLKARLRLSLAAGNGAPGPSASLIRAAAAKIPRRAPNGTYARDGKTLRLDVPAALKLNWRTSVFFPGANGPLDVAQAKSSVRQGHLVIRAPLRAPPPSIIDGVISDDTHAYRIGFRRAGH